MRKFIITTLALPLVLFMTPAAAGHEPTFELGAPCFGLVEACEAPTAGDRNGHDKPASQSRGKSSGEGGEGGEGSSEGPGQSDTKGGGKAKGKGAQKGSKGKGHTK
jgi:hypothetical protein